MLTGNVGADQRRCLGFGDLGSRDLRDDLGAVSTSPWRATSEAICGKSASPISSPSANTTARKTAFSSWRTLPGQR